MAKLWWAGIWISIDMKIIDSHMHLGLGRYNAGRIIREMDQKGIAQTWLLTWEELDPPVPEVHIDLPPDPLLELMHAYPERFVVFYAPDPKRKDLEARFRKYLDLGVRGCAELKVSMSWSDPRLDSYLDLVTGFRLPLIFHMEEPYSYYRQEREGKLEWVLERLMNDKFNGLSRYYLESFARRTGILKKKIERNRIPFPGILFDFQELEKRVAAYPQITFIGHGPGFWNGISHHHHKRWIHQKGPIGDFGPIDPLLEEYDNFYCDLSGLSAYNALRRDPDRSQVFLQKHAGKILYGSDNTGLPLLDLLQSMKPGSGELAAILSGNARKILP